MIDFFGSKINGICSICSANELVLRAAFKRALKEQEIMLIESTSNQVDQFGGYTGMTPEGFLKYVESIAVAESFPTNKIVLGGDHLGPNVWQKEPADAAMKNAVDLITAYVKAGYIKIHLDTSMRCADDPGDPDKALDIKIIADRAAQLCQAAEMVSSDSNRPLYVIGTDVPIPGGAQEDLTDIRITPVNEVSETVEITKQAFFDHGLDEAWERVIAVVVQPGVEFGDSAIVEYDRKKAVGLTAYINSYGNLVYEAHSTDYQSKQALRQMVEDHFAILKVGPWLTFALRETLFSLAAIENELFSFEKSRQLSDLVNIIEKQMVKHPKYWQAHYKGKEDKLRLARKYSYSDRIRYYWPDPEVKKSLDRLIDNLSGQDIPLSLLSQFLPRQYQAVREERIKNTVQELIDFSIYRVLDNYAYATASNRVL